MITPPAKKLVLRRKKLNSKQISRVVSKKERDFCNGVNDLDASENKLTTLGFLRNFPGLQQLNLSHNDIGSLESRCMSPSLQKIDLSYNKLTKTLGIGELSGLLELDLSHNDIFDISSLGECKNLRKLILTSNRISTINGLSTLKKLRTLHISMNKIATTAALHPLAHNIALTHLELEGNPVSKPGNYRISVFHLLPHIRVLDGSTTPGIGMRAMSQLTQSARKPSRKNQQAKRVPRSTHKSGRGGRGSALEQSLLRQIDMEQQASKTQAHQFKVITHDYQQHEKRLLAQSRSRSYTHLVNRNPPSFKANDTEGSGADTSKNLYSSSLTNGPNAVQRNLRAEIELLDEKLRSFTWQQQQQQQQASPRPLSSSPSKQHHQQLDNVSPKSSSTVSKKGRQFSFSESLSIRGGGGGRSPKMAAAQEPNNFFPPPSSASRPRSGQALSPVLPPPRSPKEHAFASTINDQAWDLMRAIEEELEVESVAAANLEDDDDDTATPHAASLADNKGDQLEQGTIQGAEAREATDSKAIHRRGPVLVEGVAAPISKNEGRGKKKAVKEEPEDDDDDEGSQVFNDKDETLMLGLAYALADGGEGEAVEENARMLSVRKKNLDKLMHKFLCLKAERKLNKNVLRRSFLAWRFEKHVHDGKLRESRLRRRIRTASTLWSIGVRFWQCAASGMHFADFLREIVAAAEQLFKPVEYQDDDEDDDDDDDATNTERHITLSTKVALYLIDSEKEDELLLIGDEGRIEQRFQESTADRSRTSIGSSTSGNSSDCGSNGSIAGYVCKNFKSILAHDMTEVQYFNASIDCGADVRFLKDRTRKLKPRVFCLPIMRPGEGGEVEVMGALQGYGLHYEPFGEEDQKLLSAFAAQVAVGLSVINRINLLTQDVSSFVTTAQHFASSSPQGLEAGSGRMGGGKEAAAEEEEDRGDNQLIRTANREGELEEEKEARTVPYPRSSIFDGGSQHHGFEGRFQDLSTMEEKERDVIVRQALVKIHEAAAWRHESRTKNFGRIVARREGELRFAALRAVEKWRRVCAAHDNKMLAEARCDYRTCLQMLIEERKKTQRLERQISKLKEQQERKQPQFTTVAAASGYRSMASSRQEQAGVLSSPISAPATSPSEVTVIGGPGGEVGLAGAGTPATTVSANAAKVKKKFRPLLNDGSRRSKDDQVDGIDIVAACESALAKARKSGLAVASRRKKSNVRRSRANNRHELVQPSSSGEALVPPFSEGKGCEQKKGSKSVPINNMSNGFRDNASPVTAKGSASVAEKNSKLSAAQDMLSTLQNELRIAEQDKMSVEKLQRTLMNDA